MAKVEVTMLKTGKRKTVSSAEAKALLTLKLAERTGVAPMTTPAKRAYKRRDMTAQPAAPVDPLLAKMVIKSSDGETS